MSSWMTATLARWLVATYPRAWRSRYQDEFVAVLENGMSWRVVVDVLHGAVDAWTTESADAFRGSSGERARAIAAYVVVLLAAFVVLRTVVGPGRLDIGLMWAVAYAAGYVALCLVLQVRRPATRPNA